VGAQLAQPGAGRSPHPIQRQVASEVAASTSSALRRIEDSSRCRVHQLRGKLKRLGQGELRAQP
jgi:hypothetical protein